MSRAFVKESDLEEQGQLPERSHSDLPNYITRAGIVMLEKEVERLHGVIRELKTSDQLDAKSKFGYAQRDLRYFEERLRRAIPVDPPLDNGHVKFGHIVTLQDARGTTYTFTLVGEDEIDIDHGRISWASPVARLLTNMAVGDEVIWPRGSEEMVVEIVDIN